MWHVLLLYGTHTVDPYYSDQRDGAYGYIYLLYPSTSYLLFLSEQVQVYAWC